MFTFSVQNEDVVRVGFEVDGDRHSIITARRNEHQTDEELLAMAEEYARESRDKICSLFNLCNRRNIAQREEMESREGR